MRRILIVLIALALAVGAIALLVMRDAGTAHLGWGNWQIDTTMAGLLGVVVDYQAGTLTFPTLHPALTTVELAQVAQMTREDGNKLHIAGEFGSNTLTFSNKRLRDECIYLLKSGTGANMPVEME